MATCMTLEQDQFPAKREAGIHVPNTATYLAPPEGDSRDNNKIPLRDEDAHQLPKTLQLPFVIAVSILLSL